MRPLARTDQPQWRGGLLPAQLGGLLDPAIERIQGVMRPENWNLTQWPSLEQIQATAAQKGPVGWEQMAPLMDAVNPMAKLGGLFAHTVWHGSPHKWDVPDISKVGSGEGAQAYGHGFYSAESPEVAKSYQDMRLDKTGNFISGTWSSKLEEVTFNGKNLDQLRQENILQNDTYQYVAAIRQMMLDQAAKGKTYKQALSAAKKRADAMIKNNKVPGFKKSAEEAKQFFFDNIDPMELGGFLYKLDIPDEDIPKYLDWDKPLSEQADGVRETLKELLEYYQPSGSVVNANRETGYARWDQDLTGAQIRELLELKLGRGKVDKELEDAGIFGIRYLDGSSRGAGEGTYNYVTFDPSRIKVLERR